MEVISKFYASHRSPLLGPIRILSTGRPKSPLLLHEEKKHGIIRRATIKYELLPSDGFHLKSLKSLSEPKQTTKARKMEICRPSQHSPSQHKATKMATTPIINKSRIISSSSKSSDESVEKNPHREPDLGPLDLQLMELRECQILCEIMKRVQISSPKLSVEETERDLQRDPRRASKVHLPHLRRHCSRSANMNRLRNLYVNWWANAYTCSSADVYEDIMRDMDTHKMK